MSRHDRMRSAPRTLLRWMVAGLCASGAGLACAQVYQCNDAQGRTLFSDAPCASGQIGHLVQPEPTPAERAAAEQRALEAQAAEAAAQQRRDAARRAREAEALARQKAAPPPPAPAAPPPAVAGWEIGTQYGAQYPAPAWHRPAPHPALGCETARQDAAVVQANRNVLPTERHRQLQAAQARVQMACGNRPGTPRVTHTPPRPAAPAQPQRHLPFSHCSRHQCYDSETGTLVHQDRHGTTVIGPSASGTCLQIGNTLRCQ